MREMGEVEERIQKLEEKLRSHRIAFTVLGAVAVVGLLGAWKTSPQNVIRTHQIIIENEAGRRRMVIGAQSDFGGQREPSIGMVLNDTLGFERFGLGLRPSGRMSMGFDAPLGKGDDRNRERINIIADEDGGAQIRFLDRETFVKGRISLTDDNRLVVDFLDFSPDELRIRRIGFDQDTIIVRSR